MDFAQELGKEIKAAREARGWTQRDLAARARVGSAQISKVERDISRASMGLILNICKAFGFDPRLLGKTGELWKIVRMVTSYGEMMENMTGENVEKYIVELSMPVSERTIPNVDIGKALNAVTKSILTGLHIEYLPGAQEYDYLCNIGNKKILISWKMGDLEDDDYRKNLLSEVTRAFNATKAHEFIVTIPDHPRVAEKLNSEEYRENLVFVYINNLNTYLKEMLESEKS